MIFSDEFVSTLATAIADRLSERIAGSTGGVTKRLLSTQEAATYLGLPSADALRSARLQARFRRVASSRSADRFFGTAKVWTSGSLP